MVRPAVLATAGLLVLTACSSSAGSSGAGSGSGVGATAKGTMVTVSVAHGTLVAPNGRTLYANSVDSPTHLICTGSCLRLWPPLYGTPKAGAGVSAKSLGTVKRGSKTQVTFAGHPLYEFYRDTGPGSMMGDGITDAGGTWHPVGSSGGGSMQPAPSAGHTAGTGGGGYGNYP